MQKKAFSLIEVTLVIVVIGLSSLGLVVIMQQVLRDSYKQEAISIATALASGEAERVFRLPFVSVISENRDNPAPYVGNLAAYSWQVRVDSIDNAQPNMGSDPTMLNYKVVEIRVHHSSIGYIPIRFVKTSH